MGSDPSRGGIQPIDAARGAGIDAPEPVLDDSRHLVARQALGGRVAGKHGTILGKPVDPKQPATIAGAPQSGSADRRRDSGWRLEECRPGIEPFETAGPVAHEPAVAAEANPDVAGGIFRHRGHIETIERREPVSIRVVMKRPGRSSQARETTGLPLTHCRHPDVTARVFEEPDHDIGSKAVALRVSSCRCRPASSSRRSTPRNRRTPVRVPIHQSPDAIAQDHLVPAPARRRVRQRELGEDDLVAGELEESPPRHPLPSRSRPARWREQRRRRWNPFTGTEDRGSSRQDLRRTRHASDPECLMAIFGHGQSRTGETQRRRAQRSEAISPGFGRGHNLDQARTCRRPQWPSLRFEDLIDAAVPEDRLLGTSGQCRTMRPWINGHHRQATGFRCRPRGVPGDRREWPERRSPAALL